MYMEVFEDMLVCLYSLVMFYKLVIIWGTILNIEEYLVAFILLNHCQ